MAARFFDELWTPAGDAFRRADVEGALWVTLDYFAFRGAMDRVSPDFRAMLMGNVREWEALTTSSDAFPAVTAGELGRLNVPVLVVRGERGLEVCRLTNPELARVLPRGEHLVIPEGTHDVCSEQPTVCAEAIRAFLARRASST